MFFFTIGGGPKKWFRKRQPNVEKYVNSGIKHLSQKQNK